MVFRSTTGDKLRTLQNNSMRQRYTFTEGRILILRESSVIMYRCTVLGCVMCCSGIWPGGKNCSCVWLFWFSVLCSAVQSSTRECAGCEAEAETWFNTTLSSVFTMEGRRETGLELG